MISRKIVAVGSSPHMVVKAEKLPISEKSVLNGTRSKVLGDKNVHQGIIITLPGKKAGSMARPRDLRNSLYLAKGKFLVSNRNSL